MNLKDLHPSPGSRHRIKRIGRGIGSGHGKTAGRGHKGLGSRSHGNTPPGYEGGQMPLQRRIPKRGFRRLLSNKADREKVAIVNLRRLATLTELNEITPELLASRGIIPVGSRLKVLGEGELTAKLSIKAHAFSKSALEKIAAAGGSTELLGGI